MQRSWVFAASLAASAFAVKGTAALAIAATAPSGLAFYTPPSPFPSGKPGDVIWSRPLSGGAALSDAAANTLVLYQTTSVDQRDVAVSGTIALPEGSPPPGGWPVISWSHGTTGNAPQCAPSRNDRADYEQTYLDAWVARGFAVVETDYEGQGTPGLHPYFVGIAAARDSIDIVRAARELYPQIGKDWFAFGHSEGGSATLFTAAIAASWAPELHLRGDVSFAPASHIAAVLDGLADYSDPSEDLPFILEMIEGIASLDPSIHLSDVMTPQAYAKLPELQRRCADDLVNDAAYTALPLSEVLRPGADLKPLLRDFSANQDDGLHLDVPLLLLQGRDDTIVAPGSTESLDRELCANGTPVTFLELEASDHATIMPRSLTQTEAWLDAVSSGRAPDSTCKKPAA